MFRDEQMISLPRIISVKKKCRNVVVIVSLLVTSNLTSDCFHGYNDVPVTDDKSR